MEQGYLIDTNAAIDYLDNKLPVSGAALIDDAFVQISVINRIELLGWANATAEQAQVLQQFIDASFIHNLEERVILKTSDYANPAPSNCPMRLSPPLHWSII